MPKKAMESLTESMFYVLMALMRRPATLYTVLAKFESEGYIEETEVEGRKRTYRITEKGRGAYRAELRRLQTMAEDARMEELFYEKQ